MRMTDEPLAHHSAQPPPAPVGPPAGWYPDPHAGAGGQRWWDGYRWTEHLSPAPPPLSLPPQPLPLAPQPPPPARAGFNARLYSGTADAAAGTNTAAIWSLVTGIASVVLVVFWWFAAAAAIAAFIWGQIGLGRARRSGVGYGMSVAGLVLGAVGVIGVILRVGTFGI